MEPVGVGVQTKPRSRRTYVVVALAAAFAIVVAFEWQSILAWVKVNSLLNAVGDLFVDYLPLTVPGLIAFAVILVLERIIPVHRTSTTGGRSLAEDMLWMLMVAPVAVFGTFWFARGLRWVFDHPLAGVSVDLTEYLPFWVVFAICFVVGDLLGWWGHYLKHKVPLLWRFHAVHHSAIDLSLFTDARVHLGEFLTNRLITVLPFFLIGGDATTLVPLFLVGRLWYARFQHANIRTNLGPLRHVITTPQYHRLHHSVEARDVDKNFAPVFTFWDRMFGTQQADAHRYPVTGFHDPNYPWARSLHPIELLRSYGKQFIYPFRRAASRAPLPAAAQPLSTSGLGLT